MHELASWNRLREHISWILPRINFLDLNTLPRTNEVVSDVNVLSPLMIKGPGLGRDAALRAIRRRGI